MKFVMLDVNEIMRRKGIEKGGSVQKFIDSEVMRRTDPYTPYRHGFLKSGALAGTKIGSGVIEQNGPYARYLYYGKVMVGRAPKTVTSKDLTYSGAPRRGKMWFERMKLDHKEAILRGAMLMARRGGK